MTGVVSSLAVAPRSLDEAVEVRAADPHLRVVHGGTDVMVGVNEGRVHPGGWLSLRRVRELASLGVGDSVVSIGAGCTFHRVQHELATVVPSLAMAARTVGSPQIRRAGTIGGNVVTASPAADSVPPMLCHDAEVELVSVRGVRRVPLEAFATGPKVTVAEPDELVAAVVLRSLGGVGWFSKVGTRNAMVISVCSLAARLDPVTGTARVAIGSVGPTVLRVTEAEALLLERDAADDFAATVAAAARPIDDVRASAAYRRHAVRVLAGRVHRRLWSQLDGHGAPSPAGSAATRSRGEAPGVPGVVPVASADPAASMGPEPDAAGDVPADPAGSAGEESR